MMMVSEPTLGAVDPASRWSWRCSGNEQLPVKLGSHLAGSAGSCTRSMVPWEAPTAVSRLVVSTLSL